MSIVSKIGVLLFSFAVAIAARKSGRSRGAFSSHAKDLPALSQKKRKIYQLAA